MFSSAQASEDRWALDSQGRAFGGVIIGTKTMALASFSRGSTSRTAYTSHHAFHLASLQACLRTYILLTAICCNRLMQESTPFQTPM